MSRALAVVATILTILHSYVSAQAPSCFSGFEWLFNSLGQSPCTMTVALGGACVNAGFSLVPLQPGFEYLGPTQQQANSCRCSTVYYSLLSACAYCQNGTYLDWSIYDVNCTTLYNQVFAEPIPPAIVVPHYAYLDVVTGNTFNVTAAKNAGGPESSSVPQATSSKTPTQTSVAAPSKQVNVGAIVGGVIGGVAGIGIIVGLIAFIIMSRRKPSVSTPSTYTAYASPQTAMSDADMKYNSTIPTMTSGRFYDPSDPTTHPTGLVQHPTDFSAFASDPVAYSTYSGSPRVTPTVTGNAGAQGPRTQYTGAPEL